MWENGLVSLIMGEKIYIVNIQCLNPYYNQEVSWQEDIILSFFTLTIYKL